MIKVSKIAYLNNYFNRNSRWSGFEWKCRWANKKEIALEYLFKIFNLDVVDGLSSRTESPARRRSIYKMYIPTLIV